MTRFRRYLQSTLSISPEESSAVLLSALLFYLLMTGYYILRPLREEMGLAGGVRDLQGCRIHDLDTDSHIIKHTEPLIVQSGAVLLFGRNPAAATNGGIFPDYAYGPGSTFLLGSHQALVLEVAEQLRSEDTVHVRRDGDRLQLFAPALRRVVEANREALVMNAVLNEGKSMDKARDDVDILVALLGALRGLDFSVRYRSDDSVRASLRLELDR